MLRPAFAAPRSRVLPFERLVAAPVRSRAQSFWTSDGYLVSAAAAAVALRRGTALLIGGLLVGTVSEDY